MREDDVYQAYAIQPQVVPRLCGLGVVSALYEFPAGVVWLRPAGYPSSAWADVEERVREGRLA
jgi:hypothetical protein